VNNATTQVASSNIVLFWEKEKKKRGEKKRGEVEPGNA